MLDTFAWTARYETGIAVVDQQHHRLVDMLNTLVDVVTGDRPPAVHEVTHLLDALDAYARVHFADEEALMAAGPCSPEHIRSHTRQHAAFCQQIQIARGEYLAAREPHATLELLARFVTSWLSFHILGSDQEMARQLRGEHHAGDSGEGERQDTASRVLIDAMEHLYDLMAERNLALVHARDELATLNASLEARVKARTAELEQALADVERTREQLLQSEKMSAIGQLAAGVAHEINNPAGFVSANLTALGRYVGNLNQLLETHIAACATLPPAEQATLEAARKAVDYDYLREDIGDLLRESAQGLDRIKKIVADMRVYSHVDQGSWQRTDLNALMDSTLHVVWPQIGSGIEVIRDYAPDLPKVECLPPLLSQVLMNLMLNAAQAIVTPPGRITLKSRATAQGVELAVQDNGQGMTPEVLHRLFEPFFTTRPVGQGTGLGLSLAYEIVRRHGGEIRVSSEPGAGSTFIISLPRTQVLTSD